VISKAATSYYVNLSVRKVGWEIMGRPSAAKWRGGGVIEKLIQANSHVGAALLIAQHRKVEQSEKFSILK
jgi:hypothetical protein